MCSCVVVVGEVLCSCFLYDVVNVLFVCVLRVLLYCLCFCCNVFPFPLLVCVMRMCVCCCFGGECCVVALCV